MKRKLFAVLLIPFLSACLATEPEVKPTSSEPPVVDPTKPVEPSKDPTVAPTPSKEPTPVVTPTPVPSKTPTVEPSKDVLTIKQVREMCEQYVTNLNQSKIGVDMTRQVTVRAFAAQKFDLVKTKKSFGLDVSAPAKVLLIDETGYICAASNGGNQGTTFFGKVGDYAGTENSYYEVTGYLSIYLGKPEIYVPGQTYTWNKDMKVNYDYDKLAKETVNLTAFYEKAKANIYNCAGHGYGDIYKINRLKCLAKNDTVYIFTDGTNYLKVIKEQVTFTVGMTYDLIGTLSLANWSPALRALKVTSAEALDIDLKTNATETTVTNFKKVEASQEDTNKRFDNYIDSFKNLYKSTVYGSYFIINGKYYVTVGDNNYTGKDAISSKDSAYNTYGMISLDNPNCWNVSWDQIEKYCPIEHINDGESFDLYYVRWQSEYVNKKVAWKVFGVFDI